MKEFTLPSPASNGLALFHYAQICEYIHLQCSNGSETCPNGFRRPKNARLTSSRSKIGQKLNEL